MSDNPSDEIVEGEVKELTITSADQFLPALTLEEARSRYKIMKEFISEQMVEDVDYGQIPGTKKATLYKPGAEKLTTLFGLRVTFVEERTVENWEEENPLFFYQRKCQLWKGNVLIAEASGSANSWESRYRWRWVNRGIAVVKYPNDYETFEKRESVEGAFLWQIEQKNPQYGTPEFWDRLQTAVGSKTANIFDKKQHWNDEIKPYAEISSFEYRIPNDDIYSLVNTILKMGEKRSLVAATLIAVNASDYFTQDMEDIVEGVEVRKEVSKKSSDTPESVISHSLAAIRDGAFSGNDFLYLGKALGYDQGEIMEVKRKYETRDEETKKVITDFPVAAQELIDRYKEINS